ncbi:MAG: carboxymuconolactone decarboxylase family protein [Rhizobiaceae bacterium]
MPQFPSLPQIAGLGDLFKLFPGFAGHLLEYTDGVMRGPGELSLGERELIASYVSGLNACKFCDDSHLIYAEAFGIEKGVMEALLSDLEAASVADELKPLLAYAKKLNTLPSTMVPADAQAILDSGWNEETLFCVIQICALFNLFNRLVEGSGVNFDYMENAENHPATTQPREEMSHSYRDFALRLGLIGSQPTGE